MAAKEIRTDNAPAPVGPYSQAIEVNGTVYCSGQIALDPKSGQMIGNTPVEQLQQLMKNVDAVLAAAGLKFENIVKTTIFLTDMKAFPDVNAAYEKILKGHRPARSTVEASALPKGALVEIECIAVR
ncbi:MAG TPA: RidA family protein [Oligoflexia bacterium]|nr:RidA family protein [Oligoflexia bacterium]